ncbi:hypothetical protein FQA39_LY12801 [Lamprigera yunnana]|nr:hypothetical protein FQA39_LY12801 [Lamprigera yunnana]
MNLNPNGEAVKLDGNGQIVNGGGLEANDPNGIYNNVLFEFLKAFSDHVVLEMKNLLNSGEIYMKKTSNKIVLIGAGSVGTSFVYAAVNQGLASEYVLIDAFANAAKGHALDIADTLAVIPQTFTSIKAGDYSDCADADLIVITAGRPQEEGETRLNMVAGNAKIMKEIAVNVSKSGFSGITLIASNPVDVLTLVYQEVTKFPAHKVIGSGTTLDSARLRRMIGEKLNVSPASVMAFLMGEHGDSSVAI